MLSRFHFSKENAIQQLKASAKEFAVLFTRSSLEIEIYKPVGIDKQTPHTRDELYVIISGCSSFYHEGDIFEVKAGDSIFVPAYDEHRFIDFTDDFTTWVFFFGPEGGEKPA